MKEFTLQQENLSNLLKKETFEFVERGLAGSWISIDNPNNSGKIEVESFMPTEHEYIGKVLFIPGMPGDSVGWMKERYLQDLLRKGYGVDLLRHSGLIVESQNTKYVSNESRLKKGGIIGKEKARMLDWFGEVSLLVKYLEETDSQDITVVSHSLGGLAVAIALLSRKIDGKKIKKWVNLSGATLTLEEIENPDFIKNLREYITQFVLPIYNFDDQSDPVEDIIRKTKELGELLEAGKNLDEVRLISVYPEKDNLINISAGRNIHDNLLTGLLINDQSVKDEEYSNALEKDPFAIHDYPHLKSETLIKILEMQVSKSPHGVTVKN